MGLVVIMLMRGGGGGVNRINGEYYVGLSFLDVCGLT